MARRTATGAAWVAVLVGAGPALAFFPPLPRDPDRPTTINPPPGPINPPIDIPPPPPPPFIPPVTPTTTSTNPPTVNPPQAIPEPATVVSAVIGLGVVAAARRKRATPRPAA